MGNMAAKTALIIQGGGARGTYAAGALKVLVENGFSFDQVYGTSAGALLGIDFVAKDPERLEKIINELTSAKGFIKVHNYFTKGSIFDFKYLLEDLPKTKLPFKHDDFMDSPTEFYAAACSVEDRDTSYFSKKDPNFLLGLASSASLPPFSKPVEIEGKGYLDGGVYASVPFEKALKDDISKIVIIVTREKGYRKSAPGRLMKRLCRRQYRHQPKFLEDILNSYKHYNEQMDLMDRLADEGRIFVLYPSIPPQVKITTQDKKKLDELFLQACEDTKRQLEGLREYLAQ